MKIGFLSILFCFLLGALTFSTGANEAVPLFHERSVGRLPFERKEPVSIRAVKVNGAKVRRNKKFIAEDDWLRGLTLEIKNRSDKRILFAAIQLQFPRLRQSNEPFAIENIEYGNDQVLTRPLTASDHHVTIAPGQSVEVKLTDERFNALAKALPAIGYYGGTQRVDLRVDSVVFEDGTMWRAGRIFQRDMSNPGLWFNSEIAALKRGNRNLPATLATLSRPSDPKPRIRDIDIFSYRSPSLAGKSFFAHASYNPPGCNNDIWWSAPQSCGEGTYCSYPYDQMSLPTGGNYFGASACALCKRGSTSCDTWRDTIIANYCGTGGGGGGRGGNLENFDNGYGESCTDDSECDFGLYCDWSSNTCAE